MSYTTTLSSRIIMTLRFFDVGVVLGFEPNLYARYTYNSERFSYNSHVHTEESNLSPFREDLLGNVHEEPS